MALSGKIKAVIRVWIAVQVLCLPGLFIPGFVARAQDDQPPVVTAPGSGELLVGVVTITGTAANPNFQRYKLEFSTQGGEGEGWFPIAEVTQQVTNGTLAQWNTVNVPDGRYQIRLRVILRSGTVLQTLVTDLVVSNAQTTPLPTVALVTVQPSPTATEGPSPTPLVQQPPTNPPPPTIAPVIAPTLPPPSQAAEQGGASDALQFVVVFEALRNAFCTGVYLAMGGFVILGVYRVVYVRLRPRLRQLMAEMRGEQ